MIWIASADVIALFLFLQRISAQCLVSQLVSMFFLTAVVLYGREKKKTPGLFTCFKMWWNWQWTEQSSGCKTLAWKGPFAVSVSSGSLFYWTVVSPSAENFSCKLFERSCPLRMENNHCSFGTPFGVWLQLILGWITSVTLYACAVLLAAIQSCAEFVVLWALVSC